MLLLEDMERAIVRDLVSRILQFTPQLIKAVNFAAELDWYCSFQACPHILVIPLPFPC